MGGSRARLLLPSGGGADSSFFYLANEAEIASSLPPLFAGFHGSLSPLWRHKGLRLPSLRSSWPKFSQLKRRNMTGPSFPFFFS